MAYVHSFQSDASSSFKEEIDSDWIHDKLPQSLVKSMNMLKNGGMAPQTFTFEPNPRGSYITGGTSLDFKLATLRHEMVSTFVGFFKFPN